MKYIYDSESGYVKDVENDKWLTTPQEVFDALSGDVERLTFALERIRGKTMSHVVDASHGFQSCKEIARDALANAEVRDAAPVSHPLDTSRE